ncbi:histidine kinase [Kitasatospora sp. NPDC008050]|uniref:sensor histidine kinase n=1 Tax=Kitasatospora sp. NPDC008050 TaxID=3364021 RepID=UPI0036E41499
METAPARPARRQRPFGWIGSGVSAIGRGAALCAVSSAGAIPPLAMVCVAKMFLDDGTSAITTHGPYHVWALLGLVLLSLLVPRVRWVVRHTRRLLGQWCAVAVADPYRPAPTGDQTTFGQRVGWLLGDPATWRDLLWTGLNAVAGFVLLLLLLPASALPVYALDYLLIEHTPPGAGGISLAVLFCLLESAALLRAAPRLLTGYGNLASRLLGPTREAQLIQRVDHLAITRSNTIDSGAAEMRRIERDLHDGAQARLVAMGMTLNAAEQLFESNPAAARALLTEAKQSSVKALGELRDLVRGIHPPVLADRGLVDAVRALALDLPLVAELSGTLPARAPVPVESAAYFAVNELLANASKHAGARRVWIEIGHTGDALRIGVVDDGRGGADPSRGTGLRGLERRLAAFDGVLAVSSPPGGPTITSLEIPCALSSPKTSSS